MQLGTINLHEGRELAALAVRRSDLRGLPLAFAFAAGAIAMIGKADWEGSSGTKLGG